MKEILIFLFFFFHGRENYKWMYNLNVNKDVSNNNLEKQFWNVSWLNNFLQRKSILFLISNFDNYLKYKRTDIFNNKNIRRTIHTFYNHFLPFLENGQGIKRNGKGMEGMETHRIISLHQYWYYLLRKLSIDHKLKK